MPAREARRHPAGAPGRRSTPDARRNRRLWDRSSASYDRRCRGVLSGRLAESWGLWRVPEREVGLLGPVDGARVLELGCGGARWSASLARRGARTVGLDQSRAQLSVARRGRGRPGSSPDLVLADAERTPFRDGAFDIVFSDYGATTFADPDRIVPEAARLLRDGGRFVFAAGNPLRALTFDAKRDRQVRRLVRPYFGLGRLSLPGQMPEHTRTFAAWFDLFRRNGFVVERLLETRPDAGARTPYLDADDDRWARRWPLECLWSLRLDRTDPRRLAGRRSSRRPSAARRRSPAGPPAATDHKV